MRPTLCAPGRATTLEAGAWPCQQPRGSRSQAQAELWRVAAARGEAEGTLSLVQPKRGAQRGPGGDSVSQPAGPSCGTPVAVTAQSAQDTASSRTNGQVCWPHHPCEHRTGSSRHPTPAPWPQVPEEPASTARALAHSCKAPQEPTPSPVTITSPRTRSPRPLRVLGNHGPTCAPGQALSRSPL